MSKGPEQGFQSPPASSSVTINTAPFQAMQTVFNVNAPLPPWKEQEIKESPYSPGYNQSFTTANTQTLLQCQLPAIHIEQTVFSQETASYPDGTIQASNGSLAFYPAQMNVFPRPSQTSVNNRGPARVCTCSGRLLTNMYQF